MSPHRPTINISPRRRSSSASTSSTLSTTSNLSTSLTSYTSNNSCTSPTSYTSGEGRHTTLKHQDTFLASYLHQKNETAWEWRWEDGKWIIQTKSTPTVQGRLDRLTEECMDEVLDSVRRGEEPWGR